MNKKSKTLVHDNGKFYSLLEVQEITGVSYYRLSKLYNSGLRELSEFKKHIKNIDDSARHCKHFVKDNNGEKLTLRQVSKIIGRSYYVTNIWYKDHGCRTVDDYMARVKSLTSDNPYNDPAYDTIKGRLTCRQIANIAGTSTSLVYSRAKKYGWDSVVVFWPTFATRGEFNAKLQKAGYSIISSQSCVSMPKDMGFDRFAHCTRNSGEDVCSNYSSCSEARVFSGKHHERFRKDGSCYSFEMKILCNGFQ